MKASLTLRNALVVLVGLGIACQVNAKPNPKRIVLPTDDSISVYVGIKGTFQSLQDRARKPETFEYGADMSVYDLWQTPTLDNMDDHEVTDYPLPEDTDWYAFTSTEQDAFMVFDIADKRRRLQRVVVTDLFTGRVIGSVNASKDGSAIVGQLKYPWEGHEFRIDGYDAKNERLLLLAVGG